MDGGNILAPAAWQCQRGACTEMANNQFMHRLLECCNALDDNEHGEYASGEQQPQLHTRLPPAPSTLRNCKL